MSSKGKTRPVHQTSNAYNNYLLLPPSSTKNVPPPPNTKLLPTPSPPNHSSKPSPPLRHNTTHTCARSLSLSGVCVYTLAAH